MKNKQNTSKIIFNYSSLGVQLAFFMVFFVYGGYKLDKYCSTNPLFLLIGAFLGIGSGMYNLIRGIQNIEKNPDKDNETENKKRWL